MSLQPRDWQTTMCRRAYSALVNHGYKSALLVAPTGSGKTVTGAFLVDRFLHHLDWKTDVFAHRREIIHQTAQKISQAGLFPGVVMAGELYTPSRDIQVCSIQTYESWVKRGKIDPHRAHVLWIDEAHRAMGATYYDLLQEAFERGAKAILTTATPIRQDGKGLGDIADVMICGPSPMELIAMGQLVQPEYFVGKLPDVKGIKIVASDFDERLLEAASNTDMLVGDIVRNWRAHANGKKTMIFATGVEHSINIMNQFRAAGIAAEHIDGETPQKIRDRVHSDLITGKVTIITNAQVYVEGTDIPCIECIIDACDTKSLIKYMQAGGRGMRTSPGKNGLIYLCHSGNFARHGRLEMDRKWELCKGKEMLESLQQSFDMTPIERVCPNCGYLFKGKICLWCKEPYERPGKEVEVAQGTLVPLTVGEQRKMEAGIPTDREKKKFFQEMKGWCEEKQKSIGVAAHTYESIYKEKVPADFFKLPSLPSSEAANTACLNRLRYLAIKKARSNTRAYAK